MFFEDFAIGQTFTTGSRMITQDEIIAFAKQWDKQSFHLDPVAAQDSIFGGLIASGFQTLLVSFDLIVQAQIWTASGQGSPGMDQVRWVKPVRPGDTLTVDVAVLDVRASRKGDRGYILWDHTTRNQADDVVMTFRSTTIALCRPTEG